MVLVDILRLRGFLQHIKGILEPSVQLGAYNKPGTCKFCHVQVLLTWYTWPPFMRLSRPRHIRVGILARLRIIDPLFFLWTYKFQLKLTITRPLGQACIHNGVKISHGKSLTMSHFCPPNYQNIESHVLNQAFSNGGPWAKSGSQTILAWPFVNSNIL